MNRKKARRLAVVLALLSAAPAVAWAAFKPLRVVAPELLGLSCTEHGVCVDDIGRLAEADQLRRDAAAFVAANVGELRSLPRTVFCSTDRCAKAYGFARQAAYNVGTAGVVIGPRGWHPHFLRHELIHRLQCERLGTFTIWLAKPGWLVEGIAPSPRLDPRPPLPEPLQEQRRRFEAWYLNVGEANLWRAAAAL